MNSFQKGNFSERQFEDLIKKKGYEVLDTEEFRSKSFRPDFLLKKDDKTILVELKSSNIITEMTLYQILYYLSKIKADSAYLALPENKTIDNNVKNKLLENNIGIITIKDKELKFEEPKTSKKLTPKDLINLEIYSENKALEEKVDVAQEELKNLSKEFFFYIVIGGVLVYVLTKLIDEYFKNILSLWILLIILVVIIVIVYLFYRKRVRKG